jgi:hypothetical protein
MWVWGSAIVLAAAVFVACGGGGRSPKAAPPLPPASTSTVPPEDAVLTAKDFHNINTMAPVKGYFIDNVNGHLDEALAVAKSKTGGVYPVGTILQLVPTEAMVKRRAGFSPETRDWEFFSLDVSSAGTKILSRGGAEVLNRFGGSCATCHGAAKAEFDGVCHGDHGCEPLPVGRPIFDALQKGDPRPRTG